MYLFPEEADARRVALAFGPPIGQVSDELELALPQVVLEAGAGPARDLRHARGGLAIVAAVLVRLHILSSSFFPSHRRPSRNARNPRDDVYNGTRDRTGYIYASCARTAFIPAPPMRRLDT